METIIMNLLHEDEFASRVQNTSMPVNFVNVEVKIKPSKMLISLANEYDSEVDRITRFLPSGDLNIDFPRYLKTLMHLHILRCTNGRLGDYNNFLRGNVYIPAAFVVVMLQIGQVTDRDYGLIFTPVSEIDSKDLMSPSELERTSLDLLALESFGLKLAHRMPSTQESGSLGSMGASLVESGEVLSYRQDHPVYGFVTAMMSISATEEILGLKALRVKYGSESHYLSLISAFAQASGSS
jgi:hypothetical protein